MSITNTIATYLIFLAYINLTKFESFISIVAVGHALRAFPYKGSSTSESSEGGFSKIAPSFFSFFFSLVLFSFFFLGGGEGVVAGRVFSFFFFFWGGWGPSTPWVDTWAISGLLPDNTGSQWEMSNFGGKGQTLLLFQCNKRDAIMWLSNFDVDIYNFMIDSITLNSASYRTGRIL